MSITDHTVLLKKDFGEEEQPITWSRDLEPGQRIFQTLLGHPDDFKVESFTTMLKNAVHWAGNIGE